MSGNLRKRLVRLECMAGRQSTDATYDLRLLHPEAVDFICRFAFRPKDDCALDDNASVVVDLLRQCEVEPIAPGVRVILPEFPRSLQLYWRHQRFVSGEIELPRGNYDFKKLSFAAQARLQLLCERHGWEPESEEVAIDPLSLWPEEEVTELCELLECAIPETEMQARRRKNSSVEESESAAFRR